jgi:ATP-dependent DNA ligase
MGNRKAKLARVLVNCRPTLALNRDFDEPGPIVFKYACALGCEGIVSKQRGSRYVAGRAASWVPSCPPAAPSVPT